jgi:methionine biosynthesis protein MetW
MTRTSTTKRPRGAPAGGCPSCDVAAEILRRADPALGAGGRDLLAEYHRLARRPARAAPEGRWQDDRIVREIPRGASVLDLGCGEGDLLARLMRRKAVRGQGVELDPPAVMRCVERGVPVFQADLDRGLAGFPDRSFDYVVLEETLQTLHRPLKVLGEMLRVGRHGIVSFPNFAWWRIRMSLLVEGRMPTTEQLPYRWHDTPNIHLFTLQDFLDWVTRERVKIVRAFAYADGAVRPLADDDTLNAEEALFFLSR